MNSALSQSAVQCDVGRERRERGQHEHRGHDQHGWSEPHPSQTGEPRELFCLLTDATNHKSEILWTLEMERMDIIFHLKVLTMMMMMKSFWLR